MTREQIKLEFFTPTINGQPHLGIQTTLLTGETYWTAYDAAGMAQYLTLLLAETLQMGEEFRNPTFDALEQFIDQRIAACDAEEEASQ